MKKLLIVTALIATSFGMGNAFALSFDSTTGSASAASNFDDPDDKIPFPHIADDGQPSNFQGQGNGGASFSFSSSNENSSSAFARAQNRMQK